MPTKPLKTDPPEVQASPSTPLKPLKARSDTKDVPATSAWSLLSIREGRLWLESLEEAFGWKILGLLVFAQWILKGFVWGFVLNSVDWIMREYSVAGPQLQVYKAVIMLPWAMKPVFGLLSDAVPIFGFRKVPYVVMATFGAVVAYAFLGLSPERSLNIRFVVACLMMGCAQVSICDLLSEARYAECIRQRPERGPDLMTFVWGGITLGSLFATATVGLILEHLGVYWVYIFCIVPCALIMIPAFLNWFQEDKMSPADVMVARARLWEQKEVMFLALLTGAATLTIAFVGLFQSSIKVNLICALAVSFIVATAFTLLLRPIIGKMNVFFFIQTCFAITIDGATFYFYTDSRESYPEGPHFSKFFYTSGLGMLVALLNLFGMYLYNNTMKTWRYHSLFIFANMVLCAINLLSILVFMRVNVGWGIPDTCFVLGQMGAWAVVHMWMWIPGVVLLSHLCPRGVEATMYALLAGCHNLGLATSGLLGAALLRYLEINPSGAPQESHQFENLWIAALIQALAPVTTLIILPWMIPNATQTEELLDKDANAVDGSPWDRWRKSRQPAQS